MKARHLLLIICLCTILYPAVSQVSDVTPSLVNTNIKWGKLANGITYYILPNKEPVNRASYYLIQNTGALSEEDNQDGFAHFLEHMAFNGSENFPGNSLVSTLEKHGASFGKDINAYTYYYETVYNLSNIPVDPPGLSDTCLLIIKDWADGLLLDSMSVEEERKVVIEEWRSRTNAATRMLNKYMPVLLRGSGYPERDIIGDTSVIKSFSPGKLSDFYRKWYRTDLQAIVVVGDIAADSIELKIKKLFSGLRPVDNAPPLPSLEIPDHDKMRYALATDYEASGSSVDLYIKIKATDPDKKDESYLREQYKRTLFNAMAASRIDEILQKGRPPFITGSISYSSFLRGYDVFSCGVTARTNEDSLAFEAIYREAEKIRQHGFTEGELKRAVQDMLSAWKNYYEERNNIHNESYISDIQSHFLLNEPLLAVEDEYAYIKTVLTDIKKEEISALARHWMTPGNRVVIVQGPENDTISHLTHDQAKGIINNVKNSQLEPYADYTGRSLLMSDEPREGKITSEKELLNLNATEWTFENGSRVIYRFSDHEKDEITLAAFSPGGLSTVPFELIEEGEMLGNLMNSYGTGSYDNITLDKILSGTDVSLTISMGELYELINGYSTPRDIETLFKLLYLKIARPRFDSIAHKALVSRYAGFVELMTNNPQKIIQDSLSLILSAYHPRTKILNTAYIESIDFNNIPQLYNRHFGNAGDFTFIVCGNIGKEKVKTLAKRYIGSLPGYKRKESWIDNGQTNLPGKNSRLIGLDMANPKSTVVIASSTRIKYKPENKVYLKILSNIIRTRLTEVIREKEGGSYSISSTFTLLQYPVGKTRGMISFECEPGRAEELRDMVFDEIKILCENGPSEEELLKGISKLLKEREESKNHNSFWMQTLYNYYMRGIDYSLSKNYENHVNHLTPKRIKNFTHRLLKKADITDIIFKPSE